MAQTAIHARMTAAEWALLVGLSVLWGGSFLFVGVAVAELPPLTIVVARVALAAAALLLALRVMGVALPREGRVWVAFLGMGVLNNAIPFTLIAWGQGHIASGVASILNATTPLFTVVVAHWLTADERMTAPKLALGRVTSARAPRSGRGRRPACSRAPSAATGSGGPSRRGAWC
jgi:drug/metabolite transporter (DMT)-like permease